MLQTVFISIWVYTLCPSDDKHTTFGFGHFTFKPSVSKKELSVEQKHYLKYEHFYKLHEM